ncbi:MAG TPA: YnfA family protein [Thermoanaerobaculia bacterium]|nr:YnfA family protein [Thermoanaerobaculia bacterium]
MRAIALFAAAALCEIGGCFSYWVFFRLSRSPLWLLPGTAALVTFAWLLSRVETPFAGRAYAAYGGMYIAASLVWLAAVERGTPDRWDVLGAVLCLLGAGLILWGPR